MILTVLNQTVTKHIKMIIAKPPPCIAGAWQYMLFRNLLEVLSNRQASGLVYGTEEIVDGLDRIECCDGHFDKYSVPVAHSAVPETG